MKHTIINKIISNRNKNTLNIEDSELKNMLKVLHKALDDKQAVDIKIIYVSKISSITEYFVITDASVVEEMAKIDHTPLYRDADKDSGWLLLDYGPIIVHILTKANREFYNLESIWGEGLEISTEDF